MDIYIHTHTQYVGIDPYTAYVGTWAWTYIYSICRYMGMDLPIQHMQVCGHGPTDKHMYRYVDMMDLPIQHM